ncbi:MAG: BMP family ABC transporter substrate-binding protein [Clostridia bacterium]|nr:BMP family ABC transporter substrate-binding protein [Clostridia bacterium]
MKRVYLTTILTCAVILALFFGYFYLVNPFAVRDEIVVGFIYNNDDSTPYSYNFSLAQDALEKQYGGQVQILTCSNVIEEETEEPLRDLVRRGCNIVFINTYSDQVAQVAREFPEVTFCQVSYTDQMPAGLPDNYHTFKGEAYQARYVSGIAAGMKLRELIDQKLITADQARVGFVAAFPTAEVISGYTAFLMGVRSVAPEATMRVKYTGTWSSYTLEKSCARQLIEEGCLVISQHCDTIGPALACEEAVQERYVYHVSYNQSMSDVAPLTSLISCRIDWVPYITGAVQAVMTHQPIEKVVVGTLHGERDMSAGFEQGWVLVEDLNQQLAAYGTQERMNRAIEQFRKGRRDFVFKGSYIGVDPDNPARTVDLSQGFIENERASSPSFRYVLRDVIIIE